MQIHNDLWLSWSWISSVPLVLCTIYRFFTQEAFLKAKPKRYFTDDIFRIFLFPGLLYYSADTFDILSDYERITWCRSGYLLHHIISLAGTKTTLTMGHFPWFLMAPFAMHPILLMFPEISFFNYVYLAMILICLFNLAKEPWRHIDCYQWEFVIGVSLIVGPLFILWWNRCTNTAGEL